MGGGGGGGVWGREKQVRKSHFDSAPPQSQLPKIKSLLPSCLKIIASAP